MQRAQTEGVQIAACILNKSIRSSSMVHCCCCLCTERAGNLTRKGGRKSTRAVTRRRSRVWRGFSWCSGGKHNYPDVEHETKRKCNLQTAILRYKSGAILLESVREAQFMNRCLFWKKRQMLFADGRDLSGSTTYWFGLFIVCVSSVDDVQSNLSGVVKLWARKNIQ